MKVTLNLQDDMIGLPLNLLGLPTTTSSWIGKSFLFFSEKKFKIEIYRKFFYFEKPSLFKESEMDAKKGFILSRDLEVKRHLTTKGRGARVYHHIRLSDPEIIKKVSFIQGSVSFLAETEKIDENITKLILYADIDIPNDFEKIIHIRSMLVG